ASRISDSTNNGFALRPRTWAEVQRNSHAHVRLPAPPAPAGCRKMQEHRHSGARAAPASPESRNTDQRNQSLGLCSCWGGRPPTASNVPGCEVRTTQPRGAVRMTIIRIGLDTSKHLFQIHGVDENETPVLRRQVRRLAVAEFFAKLAPARIGIEACGASHHWARVLRGLGHEVVLMPPQYIKPYVKRGKNDAIDAEAISRPTMRFVPIKTAEQQAALTMLGARNLLVKQRTMLINAMRGHAAEF